MRDSLPQESLPPFITNREPVVCLRGTGRRHGDRWVLRNIDLVLRPGEAVGFIGPNGAGKTTLIRLMAGLSHATEGEVTVLGHRLSARDARTPDGVALVLEQTGFVPYLSGRKNLELLARLRKVATAAIIDEALRSVELDPTDRRPVRAYSLGMRQRLSIAQALMEKPRLLLLDEPTNGLDPAGILRLRQLLRQLCAEGTAIFLASHLLTEVERTCDRVLFVQDGRILKEVELSNTGPTRVKIVLSAGMGGELLMAWANEARLRLTRCADEQGHLVFLLTADRPLARLLEDLVMLRVGLEEFSVVRQTLEEEFLAISGLISR